MVSGPLTSAAVAELIAGGEDSFTEFKSSAMAPRALAKELCGFLNGQGGRVLIGVEDDRSVLGTGGWDEERVMSVARGRLDPPAIPTWQVVEVDGAAVGVVSVDMGREKPYAATDGDQRKYHVRVGSTNREASREELVRLTQASGAVQPDLRPVLSATAEALDAGAVAERFAGRRTIVWPDLSDAERHRLLVRAEILDDATGRPTVGGLLCYGREPSAQLPHALIQCVAYPGPSVVREIVDQSRAVGPVDAQVRTAAEFVLRNRRAASTVAGVDRIEAPTPSLETIREIVANAVAHRDYGIPGPVQLRVFAGRVDVVSPGRLPNGVTPEAMRVGVSVPRNPFVVDALRVRGIIDALGRGVVLAVEEAATLGLPAPEIDVEGETVRVTLAW